MATGEKRLQTMKIGNFKAMGIRGICGKLILAVLLFGTSRVCSQDLLILTGGAPIHVNVLYLDSLAIYCIVTDSQQSDTARFLQSDVHSILYHGGITQMIAADSVQSNSQLSGTPQELILKGRSDARVFLRHRNSVQIPLAATLVTCGWACGCIANGIMAAKEPRQKEFEGHPFPDRLKNEFYYEGYRSEMWKLRARNFAIGSAIPVGIVIFAVLLLRRDF